MDTARRASEPESRRGGPRPPEPPGPPEPVQPRRPSHGDRREQRQRTHGRGSELLARVAIAIPLAVLAIGFDDVGGTAWAVVMILLGLACVTELYAMLVRWRPVASIGYAAVIGMCLAARYGNHREVLEVALVAVPVLFLAVALRGQRRGATISIAGTLLGVYWIGFAFSHSILLRQLPDGGGILIDVMLGTLLGDTGAYLGGRLFGRRLLAPAISPHKTVEGLFCGILVAIVAVYVAGLYQPWLTPGNALGLGLMVAVLGPIGDLFESLIKRDAGVKDAGRLFGAHGGALDRLDAISFTVVAAYYVWVALPHG
jgi:phosphatidate cytidylyltransferase